MEIRKRCGIFAVQLSKKVMEYKVCSKCGKELPISEFVGIKGNVVTKCQKCREICRKANAVYRERNRDEINRKATIYNETHREQSRSYSKSYRELYRDKINAKSRDYYKRNIEICREKNRKRYQDNSEYHQEYRDAHKAEIHLYNLAYYEKNKEKITQQTKDYRNKNLDKVLIREREYYHKHKEEQRPKRQEYRKLNRAYINADSVKRIARLDDYYVRTLLKTKNGFKTEEITPELIELKRATVKLKRLIKSYENETN